MLLQFTTASIITNHDNGLSQVTIGTLLQIPTTIITIYDRYYNSRQVLLQFTTGITIHDVITIHDSTITSHNFTAVFDITLYRLSVRVLSDFSIYGFQRLYRDYRISCVWSV